jgi:hypothetical protein
VWARAQLEALRSQPSICNIAAPASGTQNRGLSTALTAAARTFCHPGVAVASCPQLRPFGKVAQALNASDPSTANSRNQNAQTQRRYGLSIAVAFMQGASVLKRQCTKELALFTVTASNGRRVLECAKEWFACNDLDRGQAHGVIRGASKKTSTKMVPHTLYRIAGWFVPSISNCGGAHSLFAIF